MAQPTVHLYFNSAQTDWEATPAWTQVGSNTVVWCGSGGSSSMQQAAIPNKQRPVALPCTIVDEMWVGVSGSYVRVKTYTGAINAYDNCLSITWSSAIATAPRFTAYDAAARTATSSILAGTETDTGSTSYIKACWCDNLQSSDDWYTSLTSFIGTAGGVVDSTSCNVGQSLKADSQYLEIDTYTGGTSKAGWNFDASSTGNAVKMQIIVFTGPNLPPGTYTDRISFRYTWT
jgi:hypothetical protein